MSSSVGPALTCCEAAPATMSSSAVQASTFSTAGPVRTSSSRTDRPSVVQAGADRPGSAPACAIVPAPRLVPEGADHRQEPDRREAVHGRYEGRAEPGLALGTC